MSLKSRRFFTLPTCDIEHRAGEIIITEHKTGIQRVLSEHALDLWCLDMLRSLEPHDAPPIV